MDMNDRKAGAGATLAGQRDRREPARGTVWHMPGTPDAARTQTPERRPEDPEAVHASLGALRERFRVRCVEQIAHVHERIEALERGEADALPRDHAEILGTVHRMAGGAGTFGFPRVSAAAGKLEDEVRALSGAEARELAKALRAGLPAIASALQDETGTAPR